MALVGNDMGDAVVTALEGVDGSMTPDQKAQLTLAWRATCSAIVSYIQGHADVVSTAHSGDPLNNPSGQPIDVLTGAGFPGTGDTSAPQTIAGKGSIL